MMKLRTLIVDDEKEARDALRLMLLEYPEIEVVCVCANGADAILKIDAIQPDLVLLDIQMPDIDGFQVLNSIKEPLPAVIFVTAHDHYAIKAFEVHAVDYLLKPFAKGRLDAAIAHFLKTATATNTCSLRDVARELAGKNDRQGNVLREMPSFPDKLIIKADGKVHFLSYHQVVKVEAYDYYIKIHVSGRFYVVRESMKRMEQRLPGQLFVRIHKSRIVNLSFISRVTTLPNNDFEILLSSGETLRGSRHYAMTLKRWLG